MAEKTKAAAMPTTGRLTKTMREALTEVAQWSKPSGAPYWWRQASMAKLAELGLVEEVWRDWWGPRPKRTKRMPHAITPAGRAALAEDPLPETKGIAAA